MVEDVESMFVYVVADVEKDVWRQLSDSSETVFSQLRVRSELLGQSFELDYFQLVIVVSAVNLTKPLHSCVFFMHNPKRMNKETKGARHIHNVLCFEYKDGYIMPK